MLDALSQNAERQHLCFRNCLFPIGAIGHNTGQLRHFGKPPTIILTLGFNTQLHGATYLAVVMRACQFR